MVLVVALLANILFSVLVALPGAAAACSAANVSLVRNSASVLYIDTGISPTLQGHYAGYSITNSGSAIADAWVQVDNFVGGSVGLAPAEDGLVHLGPLGVGQTLHAYVYLAGSTDGTAQLHDVSLWSGKPGTGGVETCVETFSLDVEETIKANANKVSTVIAGPNPAILGGLMTMTVTGETGQVGDGPPGHPDGLGVFAGTPATDPTWPADAYQLVDVRYTFETSGTYNDTLVVSGLNGSNQEYTAVYTFVAAGTTTAPTSVSPVNYIASGTQIKHTSTGDFTALDPILPTENRLTLSKSASPTTLPATGGVVRYTVTISSTAGIDTALDDIEDTLPAGAVFQSGSARYNASPIADPHFTGLTMTFVGVYSVPANGSSTLVYDVALPGSVGTYTNSAVGHVGSTQIDTSIDTTDSAPASVDVAVGSPNAPPVAADDSPSTLEDTAVVVDVADNDTDPDGNLDPASVSVTSGPSNGTATPNGDGTVTYTPAANFNGTDSFTYQICDLDSECDTATVTVTVAAVNDAPDAVDDTVSTLEDTAATWDLAFNDSDVDGNLDDSTLTILSGPSHGAVTNNGDGTVTYTPVAGYSGADSLTYQICDTSGQCDTAIATISVTATADPPTAVADSTSTDENVAVTIPVADNDTDPDGNLDPSSVSVTSGPSNGTVTNNGDGTVTYTPNPAFNGIDSFTYTICDTDPTCDTATVTVTVNNIDHPPVAGDDTVSTLEDTAQMWDLALNDSDVDGDLVDSTLTILSGPSNGTVTNNGDGTVTYTPAANFNGTDSLTYQICDSVGLCDTATVSVTVDPVNDPPVANPDAVSTPEDVATTVNVVANDTDPDGNLDPSSVSVTSGPSNGTVTNNGDGTLTYSPAANYSGPDSFSYQVCDTDGACSVATATVTTTVVAVDDAPVAGDDTVSTLEDTAQMWDLAFNDSDVDGDLVDSTLTILSGPSNGTVTNNGDGTVTYTPAANFNGTDSLTYQICDSVGLCDTATVSVTVDPVDDAPVANADTISVLEDSSATVDVTFNDTDADDDLDLTSVTIVTPPTNGTAVSNGDGTVTYTPAPNFNGTDGFTYQVCDSTPACATSTVAVTVTPAPDAPFATDDTMTTAEDHAATWNLTDNDSDLDGDLDPTSVTIQTQPTHGSVSVDPATGNVTYQPHGDFNGSDSFDYQVCDTSGACDNATVVISITPVNDAPVAAPDVLVVDEDGFGGVNVIANDHDIDSILTTDRVTIITQPQHGTAIVDPTTGVISYVPNADYSGPDLIEYQVCDPSGSCDVATIHITVNEVNDPPVYTGAPIYAIIFTGTPPALTGDDPEGDVMTFTVIDGALPEGLVLLPNGEWSGAATIDGVYPITIQVCDIHGLCTTSVLSIVVGVLPFTGLSIAVLGVIGAIFFGLGTLLLRRFRDEAPPSAT